MFDASHHRSTASRSSAAAYFGEQYENEGTVTKDEEQALSDATAGDVILQQVLYYTLWPTLFA